MVRYQISPHAEARWAERHSGDICKTLSEAVPFGAQRGDSTYLRNGEVVFVVRREVVVTVLTLMQAIANMQQKGVQFDALQLIPAKRIEVQPAKPVNGDAHRKARNRKKDPIQHAIGQFLDQLRKADSDELAKMAEWSLHESFIKHYARLKKRLEQQIQLSLLHGREKTATLRYVRETFGEKAWKSAYEIANATREPECHKE